MTVGHRALWLGGGLALLLGCGRDATTGLTTEAVLGTELPEGQVGALFRAELELRPMSATPLRLDVVDGELPPGLSLSRSEENRPLISGTPLDEGRFELTLWVRITTPEVVDLEADLVIEIRPDEGAEPLFLPGGPLPEAELGMPYAVEIRARGGREPYRYQDEGDLPPGLVLSDTGELSGTPARSGPRSFGIQVEDARGERRRATFSLVVGAEPPRVSPTQLVTGRILRSYSQNLLGEGGGGGPYEWRLLQGSFPPGLDLRLRRATATVLSGLPTRDGLFTFTLELRDEAGTVGTTVLSVRIVDTLRIRSGSLEVGRVGQAYRQLLPIDNALPPLVVEPTTGALPVGLGLEPDGESGYLLVGTPTAPGTYRFGLRVRDAIDTVVGTFFVTVVP